MMQLAALLFLQPLFFIFMISALKHLLFEASAKLPPGPNAWQLLSNISQLRNKPHLALHNLAKIYGPLISIRLGGRLVVVASSSATAKAILKTHDRVFSGRYLPSLSYAIPGAIQSSNGTWKSTHSTMNDLFSSLREVESKGKVMKQKVVVEMMEYLVEKQGQVVKVDDVLNSTVCNIFGNVLASRNLLGYGSCGNEGIVMDLVKEFVGMAASPGLVDIFPVLKRVDFWTKRRGEILQQKVMCVWEDILKERRSRNGSIDHNARDFLDVLVQNAFSDDHICFVLMV
ncbi:putative (S)-N-methylcoclaurine 3'-hydroxylase isozyme 2 [Sesamum alatum]|uniref:(S)-N-methylcoclaurine 3'-hydroxylase isozyme 2 n=1 Tax=Sesamum alatum TaxID=300844 RepID=A0AAE1YUI7_9LAMI|nr:putative (S)-N-methylcoclaurine 3'-hydroxylase isozyme 2 [Sesamum alatum]KAK4436410.1 putative (S)-N-methylcoclaurine 3'-hydroxylase isozyme 2 [Sesamum alatum]